MAEAPAAKSSFHRAARAILAAALVIMLAPEGRAADDEAPGEKPLGLEEVRQRLAAVAPTFPAPPVDAMRGDSQPPEPLILSGIDLIQGDEEVGGDPPRLNSNEPVQIAAYWKTNAPVEKARAVEVRFLPRGCWVSETAAFRVGPGPGAKWQGGVLHKMEYAVDLEPIAQAWSGHGYLMIGLPSRGQKGVLTQPLQCLPVYLSPLVAPSSVSAEVINLAIGRPYQRLNVRFRLGPEAEQTIHIPARKRSAVRRVALVSAFSFGSIRQDEPVCRMTFHSEDGDAASYMIRSGVTTARADHDFYPPELSNHEKITVLESVDADYRNIEDRPFKKHNYLAFFPLPEDFGPPKRIDFVSVNEYVFEVHEVLLVEDAEKGD